MVRIEGTAASNRKEKTARMALRGDVQQWYLPSTQRDEAGRGGAEIASSTRR